MERAHTNGTYDIKYDDGDEEKHVAEGLIRGRGASIAAKRRSVTRLANSGGRYSSKFEEGA